MRDRRLSEETQEINGEQYDALWEMYEEYYAAERKRLESVGSIRATENFGAEYETKGLGYLLAGLAKGVERWANTPSAAVTSTYTIDGKRYTADSYGTLKDEYGNDSFFRIDDVGRLYKDGERIGYFSTEGIFMPE